MSDQIELKISDKNLALPANQEVGKPGAPQAQKKRTLKGMLMMLVCCAAPLLLLTASPFLAVSSDSCAGVGSGLLSIVALLACPVSK